MCSNHLVPLGQITASIEFSVTDKSCNNCNHTHSRKTSEFFCSLECLRKYCLKVSSGEVVVDPDI